MLYAGSAVVFLIVSTFTICFSSAKSIVPEERVPLAEGRLASVDEGKTRLDRSLRPGEERLVQGVLAREAVRLLLQRLAQEKAGNRAEVLSGILSRLIKSEEWKNAHHATPPGNGRSELPDVNSRKSDIESPDDEMARADRNYYGWMDFGKRSIDHADYTY